MATGVALWDDLLTGRGARVPRLRAGTGCETRTAAGELASALREQLEAAGSTRSTRTRPRPGRRRSAASTSSSRPAPPAARPSRSTCPCSRARRGAEAARALPLSDQGARAGSGPRARRAQASSASAPAIYDGDTESERRWQIRKWSNLILTNPDMLHVGVLPHHDRWGDVLSNLALRRRRRGARLPRRLRLARRQRAAAAAPARAGLRRRAAVPARLGDDREPGRARHARCSGSRSR